MAKKQNATEPVRVDVEYTLYVKLTADEVIDRAKTASELAKAIADAEAQIKAYVAAEKSELKKIKERFTATVNAANDGKEYQTVDCVQVFDAKRKETHYEYRGETYAKRAMYESEMREVTQRLFKNEPPRVEGVKGMNGDELAKFAAADAEAKRPKKGKADPKLLVQNVTPIGRTVNSDIADVIRSETNRKTKVDHVAE